MVERRFRPAVAVTVLLVVCAGAGDAAAQGSDLNALLEDGFWLDNNSGLRQLDLHAIAVDPERPTRLYAGAEGLLYRSFDGGDRWEVVRRLTQSGRTQAQHQEVTSRNIDGLTDEQLDRVEEVLIELENELFEEVAGETNEVDAALAVEAARDDLLIEAVAIVRDEEEPVEESTAVVVAPEERPENLFSQIVIDPHDTARIYAASGRGLLYSADYGSSWEELYRGVGGGQRQVSSVVVVPDAIVLGTAEGVFRSDDDGETWSRVTGPPARNSVAFVVDAPSDSSRLYAVAAGRVYRSDNSGESWSQEAVPIGVRSDEVGNIAVHPLDPDLVYLATANGVMVSRDAGATLDSTGTLGLRERRVTWVACAGDDLLAGTLDGIYASFDEGQSWNELNDGMSAQTIRQIALSAEPSVWVATDRGIYELVPRRQLVPSEEAARTARESWAADPNLALTIEAALIYNGYDDVEPGAWIRRLNLRRFLPELAVEWQFRRNQDIREEFVPVFDSQPRTTDRLFEGDAVSRFRAGAVWDVLALIRDPRELRLREEIDELIVVRHNLVRDVVLTYRTRRQMLLRLAESGERTVLRYLLDWLEADELAARLDMLTGGFYSAYRRTGASR